ncbi:MAG: substrate-binding domain-containing protein [Proteobacteria bacterium]|nr:substrate-binding domain-containing protein [Pseudomonadota bacterium]MBU1686653.1 substrate-binding domain-containing protein [Pseudomonadota bacterium]
MIRRLFFICMLLVFLPTGAFAGHLLEIPGTGDSQELMRLLADDFAKLQPGFKVVIPDSIGSGGGIKNVAAGLSELGRVARPLKEKEKRYGLSYREFARSPVVFIVNESVSGIDNLTSEQVVGIYSGRITDWGQLGASPGKIYVVDRENGDSSRAALEQDIPGFSTIKKTVGKTIYTTPELVQSIALNENTVGYTALSMAASDMVRVLKINGADGVGLTADEGYPLMVPFALVWKGELSEEAGKFMEYLFSEQAGKLIRRFGALLVH